MSDVSSTLDSIDHKTPRKTNNDINYYYYYNKNNFTDRRISSVPLHRSENLKKDKRKRFVSALRAEQRVGSHRDGRAGGQIRCGKMNQGGGGRAASLPSPALI